MSKTPKIEGTAEAWENGELGCDDQYAKISTDVTMDDLNMALESRPISIRMKESMIDDLKFFAEREGLGYQTLIKSLLQRFIDGEYKRIVREQASEKDKAATEADLEEGEIGLQKTA